MAVDDQNGYLVTGDSDGVMKIWDIQDYYKTTLEIKGQNSPRMFNLADHVLLRIIANFLFI